MWGAGDNAKDKVKSHNITVANSEYYEPCPADQGRISWEKRDGEVFTNGGPDVTKLTNWEPREEFVNSFPWDNCGLSPPSTKCDEFPVQTLGHDNKRVNINKPG